VVVTSRCRRAGPQITDHVAAKALIVRTGWSRHWGIYVLEHLTALDQFDAPGFEVFAVSVKVRGMGTFPVRAFARWPT
jgi:kynurenine formamidase